MCLPMFPYTHRGEASPLWRRHWSWALGHCPPCVAATAAQHACQFVVVVYRSYHSVFLPCLTFLLCRYFLSVYVFISAGFAVSDVISVAIILSLILLFYGRGIAYRQQLLWWGSNRIIVSQIPRYSYAQDLCLLV